MNMEDELSGRCLNRGGGLWRNQGGNVEIDASFLLILIIFMAWNTILTIACFKLWKRHG
jgi:hypothetical protein